MMVMAVRRTIRRCKSGCPHSTTPSSLPSQCPRARRPRLWRRRRPRNRWPQLLFPNKPDDFHSTCTTYARTSLLLAAVIFLAAGNGSGALTWLFWAEVGWQLPIHPASAMFVSNHPSLERAKRAAASAALPMAVVVRRASRRRPSTSMIGTIGLLLLQLSHGAPRLSGRARLPIEAAARPRARVLFGGGAQGLPGRLVGDDAAHIRRTRLLRMRGRAAR